MNVMHIALWWMWKSIFDRFMDNNFFIRFFLLYAMFNNKISMQQTIVVIGVVLFWVS